MNIVCSLATFSGREFSLKTTLDTLYEQTVKPTTIFVYDNKLMPDITDNGKFWILQTLNEPVWFFSMDDDLAYPKDYIESSIEKMKETKSIVTYHGRILTKRGAPYYSAHTKFKCLDDVKEDTLIDVAGTGVTCFSTEVFNPVHIWKSNDYKMADLVFSLEAKKKNVPIICARHEAGWIRHVAIDFTTTISETENNKTERQTWYADQIIKMK